MKRRKQESLRFENLFWSLRTQSGLLTYAKLIVLAKCSFNKSWGIAACKGIQDSLGFRIPRHGLQVLDTGFLVSGTWIPHSNRLRDYGFLEMYIPYSKA